MHTSLKGIYIHVPFCAKKCPYCNFYSVWYRKQTAEDFTAAAERNIALLSEDEIRADTLYFGGGTPSLLSPGQIGRIIEAVRKNTVFSTDSEITVECNPSTMTDSFIAGLLEAGVNRISVGIQSLDDEELKLLGRSHTAKKAADAVIRANKAGFENISCDMMTALPGQTAGKIRETVRQYAALPVKHISAYMLKIEEGTPFYEERISLPDDDRSADIYLAADEELSRAGFERYEISNFAKQGFESRHNTKYWHCCEVIGIGPGAHSFQKGVRTACYADLERFIREERQPEYLVDEAAGSAEERLMLGLRLTEGVSLSEYGIKENRQINDLKDHGLIKIVEGRLSLTSAGALVSNAVICRIIENINI